MEARRKRKSRKKRRRMRRMNRAWAACNAELKVPGMKSIIPWSVRNA